MRIVFLSLLLFLAANLFGFDDTKSQGCGKGCTTTITVVDCNSDPVANAEVTIRLCCNEESHSSTTDSNGEVKFDYCLKDICARSIRLNVPSAKLTEAALDGCSEGKDAKCTVKICSGAAPLSSSREMN